MRLLTRPSEPAAPLGPTHADAALAAYRAARNALIEIAGWGECETDRKIAHAAMVESRRLYTEGVRRAID